MLVRALVSRRVIHQLTLRTIIGWKTCPAKNVSPFARVIVEIRAFCTEERKTVFSGIQPSGILHIGNYLGMVQPLIRLQRERDVIISVVDLHAMTTYKEPAVLRRRTVEMAASLIACGVDVRATVLFRQSVVPLHTQLAWLLGVFVTIPQLSHLSHFREKTEIYRNGEVPVNLLIYPVLQAADILLYRADEVPVGEDQTQHIRLAQKIANAFNNKYQSKFFPVPVQTGSIYGRVKSLRDPLKKMSKSDLDGKSCLNINDPPEVIKLKVQKAVTDCTSELTYDPQSRPGVSNLLNIHAAMTNTTVDEVLKANANRTVGDYKTVLAEVLIETLKPIRENIRRLTKDEGFVISSLAVGQKRAEEIASRTYEEVRKLIGIQL